MGLDHPGGLEKTLANEVCPNFRNDGGGGGAGGGDGGGKRRKRNRKWWRKNNSTNNNMTITKGEDKDEKEAAAVASAYLIARYVQHSGEHRLRSVMIDTRQGSHILWRQRWCVIAACKCE